ncbi:MAG: MCP four helix bundle domain-containing protein [Proteobacteria bacterium]|nr:MCP four helix bundle domain-containing protein [Pseudomonadota bacterium]
MSFQNVKLGTKIGIGFGIILFLLGATALIGLTRIKTINSYMEDIISNKNAAVLLANDLSKEMNIITQSIRNIALSVGLDIVKNEKNNIDKARAEFNNIYLQLTAKVKDEKGKELLSAVVEHQQKIDLLVNKAVDFCMSGYASSDSTNVTSVGTLTSLDGNARAADVIMLDMLTPQKQMIEAVEAIIEYQGHLSDQAFNNAKSAYTSARYIMISLAIAAILLGSFIAFFLTQTITKPINYVVKGLTDGSEQVVSATLQVSSSSQSLAEGASEQAASIEETSSSLEEMSSMTKQNSDNATQADNLMKEANQVVEQANNSMEELTKSMYDISLASDETSKIIKTIDEIAFQTNLLALNAAVEAARAGEAGAGFAVVADEVRNLAMRSADAAKNTAQMIEGTVKKVREGSELVTKTNKAFQDVSNSSSKVGELVGEIAAASKEQSQGIEQINKAVAEMDKIVQRNAANAEESASASGQMNAQAKQLKQYVRDLVLVIGGKNANDIISSKPLSARSNKVAQQSNQQYKYEEQTALPPPHINKHEKKQGRDNKALKPEQLIPFEEDDFQDF